MKVCLGIDVSAKRLDCYHSSTKQSFSVDNTASGHRKLLKELAKNPVEVVVMESTGMYHRQTFIALSEAGHNQVAVVNACRIRNFANALDRHAKTDAIDAEVIAQFGAAMSYNMTPLPSKESRELRDFQTRRDQLMEMLVAEKNRLHQATETLKKSIKQHLQMLKKQLKELDSKIEELIDKDPQKVKKKELLRNVPGIGKVVSNGLITSLPELGSYSKGAISALVGVAPYNCDSGKFKGKRTIFGGRAPVRSLLYMATLSAIRCNEKIKAKYASLRARGKPAKVALVACMRKLLIILNAILRQNASSGVLTT